MSGAMMLVCGTGALLVSDPRLYRGMEGSQWINSKSWKSFKNLSTSSL
jgi:hypothetical protein